MPLIKIETVNSDCKWALWEITESFENLAEELNLTKEAEQIETIKNDSKKQEKIAGRLLLKKILESWNEMYEGTDYNDYGKPILNNHNYYISISHSNGHSIAIIDKKKEVGIDIELIKDKILVVAPRVFSEEEIGADKSDLRKLTTLWSIKESLYKVYGNKRLNFKENIRIKPFKINKDEGVCVGVINTDESISNYQIKYSTYKDSIITYILN